MVLHTDPELEPDRARNAYQSHLARAKWITEWGRLLRGAADQGVSSANDLFQPARVILKHHVVPNQGLPAAQSIRILRGTAARAACDLPRSERLSACRAADA
jgi:hypothetical protein